MWRTLIVQAGEKITLQNNWLYVCSEEHETRVPVGDLYSVVIDNRRAMLSVAVLTTLAQAGVHILFCDESHLPTAQLLPLNAHYQPLAVLSAQMAWTQEWKDLVWQRIVQAKITNQARALRFCHVKTEKVQELEALAAAVLPGDKGNREAQAAKHHFRALFGAGFTRGDDDVTNAALNYGYTILRSAVCKTLAAYGYNCALGVHHIGRGNAFNLADDLMEPLRPLVDYWVDSHCDELFETLTKSNRSSLIALVNHVIRFENKKMRVRYAIDWYVKSFTAAVQGQDAGLLRLPELLRSDPCFEDEQDG